MRFPPLLVRVSAGENGDMGQTQTSGTTETLRARFQTVQLLRPGLLLCLGAAVTAWLFNRLAPTVSPLIIALVLGIALANTGLVSLRMKPGTDFAAKTLLRAGIVLLGLQISLNDVLELGIPVLLVMISVVAGGIAGTLFIGSRLGVPPQLRLLIACGFSICGAAAVAGISGALRRDEDGESDTVTAVGLVVLFGSLMIPIIPLLSRWLNLDTHAAALWAGGVIHEVAQVVAVGGRLGGGALGVAIMAKLTRVLLLAPVVIIFSISQHRAARHNYPKQSRSKLPPPIPLFVAGFVCLVVLRTFLDLPAAALSITQVLQTGLLTSAMFALGTGVRFRNLFALGPRPFVLAASATVLVSGIGYFGVHLVG